jgi:predicted phage-related endonuclease
MVATASTRPVRGLPPDIINARKGKITASIAPAICGVDPYTDPATAFLLITGRVERLSSDAMEWGQRLEPLVLEAMEEQYPEYAVQRTQVWSEYGGPGPLRGMLGATLDAEINQSVYAEAKTSGLHSGFTDLSEWGEPGSSQVPARVSVQAAVQFLCNPAKKLCVVPTFIGGRGFALYEIPRPDDLIEAVKEQLERFAVDHLAKNVIPEPTGCAAFLDAVKQLPRVAGKTVQIDDGLMAELLVAREALKLAEKEEAAAKAKVMAALEDAEIGEASCGRVTWKRTKDVAFFDKERLAAEQPALVDRYTSFRPGHRVFLVKRTKE